MPEKERVQVDTPVSKDLAKLHPKEAKAFLAWVDALNKGGPLTRYTILRHMSVPVYRAKLKERIRIMFRIIDDVIWVIQVDLRDSDTYDKTTLTNRIKRLGK